MDCALLEENQIDLEKPTSLQQMCPWKSVHCQGAKSIK